jgi:integrase/recombinase XerD
MTYENYLTDYLHHLEVKHFAKGTIDWRRSYLRTFFSYLQTQGISDPKAVTRAHVESFKAYLKTEYRTQSHGQPLTDSSFASFVTAVTDFFRWLERSGQILMTPAPRPERTKRVKPLKLPQVLSVAEVLKILESCPINTPAGLRDRAILELLYSTGIRREELANLNTDNYFPESQELRINEGKGKKDRVVPVGEYACLFTNAYLQMIRPWLAKSPAEKALFLDTQNGGRLSGQTVGNIVKKAVHRCQFGRRINVTPHTFRHTMATHMLRNQADLRHIQAILGHSSLASTEVYTHLTVENLKQVMKKAHSRSRRPAASPEPET